MHPGTTVAIQRLIRPIYLALPVGHYKLYLEDLFFEVLKNPQTVQWLSFDSVFTHLFKRATGKADYGCKLSFLHECAYIYMKSNGLSLNAVLNNSIYYEVAMDQIDEIFDRLSKILYEYLLEAMDAFPRDLELVHWIDDKTVLVRNTFEQPISFSYHAVSF